MDDEIKALREELAKLRERVAVLEVAAQPRSMNFIDWTQPVHIGSPGLTTHPRLVPMEPLAPGTIICGTGGLNG